MVYDIVIISNIKYFKDLMYQKLLKSVHYWPPCPSYSKNKKDEVFFGAQCIQLVTVCGALWLVCFDVMCSWAVHTRSCRSTPNAIGCGWKPRMWCTLNSCCLFSATLSKCWEVRCFLNVIELSACSRYWHWRTGITSMVFYPLEVAWWVLFFPD